MAIIQAGFVRATEDIDLLVDTSPENITRLRQALVSLPDRSVIICVANAYDEPISGIGRPAVEPARAPSRLDHLDIVPAELRV